MALDKRQTFQQKSQLIWTYRWIYKGGKSKDALIKEGLCDWPLQNLEANISGIKGECSRRDYRKIRGSKRSLPHNKKTEGSLCIYTSLRPDSAFDWSHSCVTDMRTWQQLLCGTLARISETMLNSSHTHKNTSNQTKKEYLAMVLELIAEDIMSLTYYSVIISFPFSPFFFATSKP